MEPNTDQTVVCGQYPKDIIVEASKDLNKLVSAFEEYGVQVVRVAKKDWSKLFDVEGFKTPGFFCYSPRDIPFIYHDSMY